MNNPDAENDTQPTALRRSLLKLTVGVGVTTVMSSSSAAGYSHSSSSEQFTFTMDNVGASAWEVPSADEEYVETSGEENPTITLETGVRYTVSNEGWSRHPVAFYNEQEELLLSQEPNENGAFENDNDINWSDSDNSFSFTLTEPLAQEINTYICTVHSNMVGQIETTDTVRLKDVNIDPDEVPHPGGGGETHTLTFAVQNLSEDGEKDEFDISLPKNVEVNNVSIDTIDEFESTPPDPEASNPIEFSVDPSAGDISNSPVEFEVELNLSVSETDPAAVVDQARVALNEADVDTYNQLIYSDGPLNPIEGDEYDPAENLESIELTIEEISPSTYESRTGETFDQQQAETRLSEIGADEFAVVWWEEQYRAGQDVPVDSLAVYLLYFVDEEWLLYDSISSSEQIAIEDIDEPMSPFANSPTGVVEQFYVSAFTTGDADAVNEVLYPESPQEQVTDDDVQETDRRALVGAEERSVERAAEAASFSDPEDLEMAGLLAQDRYGVEYQFVVVSTAAEGDRVVERSPVLTVKDDGDWFVHKTDFE